MGGLWIILYEDKWSAKQEFANLDSQLCPSQTLANSYQLDRQYYARAVLITLRSTTN